MWICLQDIIVIALKNIGNAILMNKEVYHKGCDGNLIENVNSSMNALRDLIPEHLISRFEGVVYGLRS